jgi:hypothetical protein
MESSSWKRLTLPYGQCDCVGIGPKKWQNECRFLCKEDRRIREETVVYYESRNGELKIRLMNLFNIKSIKRELKPQDDESTCLVYTGLLEGLEYLKIETRLIDEKFASVMGE